MALLGPKFNPSETLAWLNKYEYIRMQIIHIERRCIMSKTITLRLSPDHYEVFRQYAAAENRKISNAIETLALKQLERETSVSSQENDRILANKDLMGRIREGIKQAKAKKGRIEGDRTRHARR
jgi:hypothetical protein